MPIYVTKFSFSNENQANYKICQIAIRRPVHGMGVIPKVDGCRFRYSDSILLGPVGVLVEAMAAVGMLHADAEAEAERLIAIWQIL